MSKKRIKAMSEEKKELPKIREKWLRLMCERCSHAHEKNGCGGSHLICEEYRRDCLFWSRKLRGEIEKRESFDDAFRLAFEKMGYANHRHESQKFSCSFGVFNFYGSSIMAWPFVHYIMCSLGWGLSEVEEEIIRLGKEGILRFPGSPPLGEEHLQKISVGIYGRSGAITWRNHPKL